MLPHKPGKKVDLQKTLLETDEHLDKLKRSIDRSASSKSQEKIREDIKSLTELRKTILDSIEVKKEMIALYGKDGWDTPTDSSPEKMDTISLEDEKAPALPLRISPRAYLPKEENREASRPSATPTKGGIHSLWRFFKSCCTCCYHPPEEKVVLLTSKVESR